MPEPFPLWLFLFLLIIWVVARLAHKEAMRHLKAARIVFDDLTIHRAVDLWGTVQFADGRRERVHQGLVDIASIKVRNVPYDGAEGKAAVDAFARMDFFDKATLKNVLSFDYPRWEGNPKPGYHVNPTDHYPDEWKRRTLPPSGEASRLDFMVKSIDAEVAFGFRGRSQLMPTWSDPRLRLPAGDYVAKLTIAGVNLRKPAEQWFSIDVGGAGRSFEVEKAKPIDTKRWW
jgi:hypothetical protein